MKNLDLINCSVQEMNAEEINGTNGGFLLPFAVIGGIWVFQACCCVVALGMKARLDQER